MPPNALSNSRLPQLAVWSGYGTGISGEFCKNLNKLELSLKQLKSFCLKLEPFSVLTYITSFLLIYNTNTLRPA